jgi:hypothetical protein
VIDGWQFMKVAGRRGHLVHALKGEDFLHARFWRARTARTHNKLVQPPARLGEETMVQVSNEELRRFDEKLKACQQRIGGGKVAMDSAALR